MNVVDGGIRPALSVLLALLFVWPLSGCRTREDSARKAGREAALATARRCQADGGSIEGCRERLCRDLCAAFSDSSRLSDTCSDRCMGRGICDNDSDCGPDAACVTIAPRVRRCEPKLK